MLDGLRVNHHIETMLVLLILLVKGCNWDRSVGQEQLVEEDECKSQSCISLLIFPALGDHVGPLLGIFPKELGQIFIQLIHSLAV